MKEVDHCRCVYGVRPSRTYTAIRLRLTIDCHPFHTIDVRRTDCDGLEGAFGECGFYESVSIGEGVTAQMGRLVSLVQINALQVQHDRSPPAHRATLQPLTADTDRALSRRLAAGSRVLQLELQAEAAASSAVGDPRIPVLETGASSESSADVAGPALLLWMSILCCRLVHSKSDYPVCRWIASLGVLCLICRGAD